MIKADATFFKYYLPALKKALEEDHINYGFMVKGGDWWFPDNLSDEMNNFIEAHYEEYPILEDIAYYFDAKSHNFPNIQGIDIDDYRSNIIQEISILKKKYNIQ